MSTTIEWVVMSAEPLRPTIFETVLYEPDDDTVIAVLPGSLWLAPGDIVEVDDPPKDARVLSTRLQLRGNEARVLIVLDIPADADDALRGDTSTQVALGAELDHPLTASAELDNELEKLTEELHQEAAPDETSLHLAMHRQPTTAEKLAVLQAGGDHVNDRDGLFIDGPNSS